MVAQVAEKSEPEVGTVGGGPQSRSATPRTSVAQHCEDAYRPEQGTYGVWRSSSTAGAARAAVAAARTVKRNFMLKIGCGGVLVGWWLVESGLLGCSDRL